MPKLHREGAEAEAKKTGRPASSTADGLRIRPISRSKKNPKSAGTFAWLCYEEYLKRPKVDVFLDAIVKLTARPRVGMRSVEGDAKKRRVTARSQLRWDIHRGYVRTA